MGVRVVLKLVAPSNHYLVAVGDMVVAITRHSYRPAVSRTLCCMFQIVNTAFVHCPHALFSLSCQAKFKIVLDVVHY